MIERLMRAPGGWSVVALHLSRLAVPQRRAHHGRIARALLHSAAQRCDGQTFALRNGDVVLLHRSGLVDGSVPDMLRRLFGGDTDDPDTLVSEWPLPHAGAPLLAYTADRIADLDAFDHPETVIPTALALDAAAAALQSAPPHELIRQQAAVVLEPAGRGSAVSMRLFCRRLSGALERLEARLEPHLRPSGDATLRLHFGRNLDQRLLQILARARGSVSPLDVDARPGLPLHLDLSLPGLLSDEFAAFATLCRNTGVTVGAVVSLVEAVGDPAGFARAGEQVNRLGALLVLDGVSHLALLLARPAVLRSDLIRLHWSAAIGALAGTQLTELTQALADADPRRLILDRADSEAAVRWGLAQGIRCFQGRHIDRMLAAQRMLGCPGAPACTVRQCADRMRATGGAERAECTNLELLDAWLPASFATARESGRA